MKQTKSALRGRKSPPKRSSRVVAVKSKSSGRFNKFHLLILVVLFAIVGAAYTFASRAATSDGSVGVYRVFQSASGEHLLTTSEVEKNALVPKAGFSSEGFGFSAWTDGNNGRKPVYRLAGPGTNGKHLLTMSVVEKDALVKGGWKLEGVAFYAYDTGGAGRIPAYRLSNKNGDHLITTSGFERDELAKGAYSNEGIAFYVSDGVNTSTPPQNKQAPSGSLDPSSCSTLVGWALDGDSLGSAVRVDAYVQGIGIASGATNVPRPDITRIFYAPGNHGYSIKIPSRWLDGKPHNADIYGININSKGALAGENAKIGHREFACDAAGKDHMPEVLAQRAAEEKAAREREAKAKADQEAAAAAAAKGTARPDLSLGSFGTHVTAFQQRLANRGFWIATDGVFGATMEHWVRAFSIEIGLGNIGVVDGRTYQAMDGAEANNWRFDPNDPLLSVLQSSTPTKPVVVNPGGGGGGNSGGGGGGNSAPATGSKCGPNITVPQCEAFGIYISKLPPSPPATPVSPQPQGACRGYNQTNGGPITQAFGISTTFSNCWNQHNTGSYPELQHIDWDEDGAPPNGQIWQRIDPVVVARAPEQAPQLGYCIVPGNYFGNSYFSNVTYAQCKSKAPYTVVIWRSN